MLEAVPKSLGPRLEGRNQTRLASLARPLRRRSRSEPVAFTSAGSEAVKGGDLVSFDGRRLLFPARYIRSAAGMARIV
jgi:hypothetical protein